MSASGCPARHEVELDGQHRLADDHQRRVVDQPVEHGGHGASTVFSIGTNPASIEPARSAASTAGLPAHGTSSASAASGSVRSALLGERRAGPEKPMRCVPPAVSAG
jgi:hypothetical protein